MVRTLFNGARARNAADDRVSSFSDQSMLQDARPCVRDGTLDDRSYAHSGPQLQRACAARRVLAEHHRGRGEFAGFVSGHRGGQQLDRRIARARGELFNSVLERLDEPVVLLLNNDVKLAANAVEPLVGVFESHDDVFFSAPCCWTFDGLTYEGMRTRVRSRFGLVQGMSRVPGFAGVIEREDLTAAAGPVLAIDRRRFLAVGGYDPIYFPGRIEDLDLGFRSWMAGYRGYYVPDSVAYHKGFATFEPQLGKDRCDELASRNTLIFMWKNLGGARLLLHFLWLPIRFGGSLLVGRPSFARGFFGALKRVQQVMAARRALAVGQGGWVLRQEAFFRRFEW
jgi:N-acetylglucosaminyl-diphospho-decaprenol L-rhamnosyltransferase